ncbi:DUF2516 family protein [Amycolatopsis sp.]|uniref:DUF2516 family protein n=1 Tax=Amycolatopsis sp. TaxID=37632 RepID=UPI002605816F|nr:DUF2516 family protein [Amycolatopsis sp.]
MVYIAGLVELIIQYAGALTGLFAFVHSALQKRDAYSAADRKTKPIWVAITGGSTLAMGLFPFYSAGYLFWMAGLVASLVYIVDVRPKLNEVQRGGRNW